MERSWEKVVRIEEGVAGYELVVDAMSRRCGVRQREEFGELEAADVDSY